MEEESSIMSPRYFRLICEDISKIWRTYLRRIQLLKLDLGILEVFCMCLETWRLYSIADENEESMERLRSLITSLKVIWPEDLTLLSLLHERMDETRAINDSIQDNFDWVMSGLEAKILQTKPQVEGWCRNSIHSSLMVHCKSSPNISQEFILHFLTAIQINLPRWLRYRPRAGPLNKQIDILKAKIVFLEGKLIKVLDSMYKEEGFQFLEFIGGFANGVACLTCLYWAKEDDDHDEMNIVLFDMFHKFIPYAFHITQLYVGILKSNEDLHLVSDSFLLEEVVEGFVDFFFEHLAVVLKDDFLFLRDRLMFLFTFLIGPPNENAEEGDFIRSQINAILHEDVYLLMSFDEVKEDFSGEKALLSGFMTRIDIANTKIRKSSESWITFEVEKMEYDYVVSVLRELSLIEKFVPGVAREEIQLYKMELRFLRVFLQWLATRDDADEKIKVKLSSIITSFRGIWGEKGAEGLLAHRLHAIRRRRSTGDWCPLAFELQGKIQQSKLETEAWCVSLFDSSFQLKTSTSYKILKFLDSIHDNLKDLVSYNAREIVPFKKQIETLEGKLIFMRNFLKLAVNCVYYEAMGEFEMFVQAFANDAACLTILYWATDANVKCAEETNSILVHICQKIKPATPDVARLYFEALMAIYVQQSDSRLFGQTALSFVELFLEDLVTHLKDDDFQILQDNIVSLLTFLNDPLTQNAEESICSRIDVLFWEGLYGLTPFDDIEGGFSKKKVLLSEFMMKIEAINADIICIYGKFPHSSLYNFPKVVSPQFLDFLLQNLRNLKDRMNSDRKYAPFAKYRIIKIEEELASLSPFFIHIFDLQSVLNETWLEVVNVLHLTEHVVMSSISSWFVYDYPFLYHMAYLSNVLDEIKVVKAKLEMVKLDNIINNAKCLPSSVGFISEDAESLAYYRSEAGCMDILEINYKLLPDNLKPCLIYLGTFPEDSLISVKHVIHLWISEGFIQESKTKNLEDVAKEYFHELVNRSFIIASVRSSSGGIKAFRVHDLIRDLCQTKCRDGKFFHMNQESASSSSSEPSVSNHYRVSIQKESDVINVAGSSFSDARTIHIFCEDGHDKVPLGKFKLAQVLDLGIFGRHVNDIYQVTSLIHLRYIKAWLSPNTNSIPSSISNLWNIMSLNLTVMADNDVIHLPETFWRMKNLRYVKVFNCILKFLDEAGLSGDQIMDKVVSFSKPILSTGKDVERLLQRLPVVQKLSCTLKKSPGYDETLDFYVKMESLTLTQPSDLSQRGQYIINFPSTLKRLNLEYFVLPRTALSAIAELHCLEVLKLRYGSFVEPSLEIEDLVFRNLKFFQLIDYCLEEWNASSETFPCLEQLVIQCKRLKELPPCFGVLSTLKRIGLNYCSPENESSVLRIQEELMELGIQLEVSIKNT